MEPRASRLVVCIRIPVSSAADEHAFLPEVRALDARATSRGGVRIASSAGRVAYAFAQGDVTSAVSLVAAAPASATGEAARPLAAGLAEGDLAALADGDGGAGSALSWGRALVVASALASAAKPGEIACDAELLALRSGLLLRIGRVRVRALGRVIEGARVLLDAPFREEAVLQVSRLRVPPLVGARETNVPIASGSVTFVRADRGFGGTRLLETISASAPRTLLVQPVGSGLAPMGSVRRAVERSITHDLGPRLVALAEALDALLSGEALDVDTVASLVDAFFSSRAGRAEATSPAMIAIDDADQVDAASLEACARALQRAARDGTPLAMIVRLPRGARGEGVPPALSALPRAGEVELGPLSVEDGARLAASVTSGGIDDEAAARWAARGEHSPLGIVEALTSAVGLGLLAWPAGAHDRDGGAARMRARSRSGSRGPARPAAAWLRARAEALPPAAQLVLATVAMFGGEAKQARLARVVEDVDGDADLDLERVIGGLVREKLLLDAHEDWLALPTRTHKEVAGALLPPMQRLALHGALSAMLRSEEGTFGRAEAAFHAAAEGDVARAARSALDVARAAGARGLEASVASLVAFARRTDPSCEEMARDVLAALAKPSAGAPARVVSPGSASEKLLAAVPFSGSPADRPAAAPEAGERPTTPALPFTPLALPVSLAPPSSSRASEVAERLGELAREAMLNADSSRLEQVLGDFGTERPMLTERMRALARVGRGEVGDALRVLRRMRDGLPPGDLLLRSQTSLALGVALAMGGRPAEALLEGLDALARAREAGDARGARACLAFLAKLYASVGRPDDAQRLSLAP